MRLLLTSVAHDRFWSVVARPGVEPLVLERDGGLRDGSSAVVTEHDADLAWGTGDLFVDGAPAKAFFAAVSDAISLQWFQTSRSNTK